MNPAVHFKSLKRTILMAVIVISVAVGVTFAILQSRGVLTGNTISTASANLLVSTDGVHYGQAIPGFNFENIIPGGYPTPADGYPVFIKNTGNTPVELKLTLDGALSNPDSANLNKLHISLVDDNGSIAPRDFILQSLVSTATSIEGDLAPGAVRHYKLQVTADDDADAGKTIGNIDLAFIGLVLDPNGP